MLLLLSVAESLHSAVSTKHICVVSICGLQHTVCGMAKVSSFFFLIFLLIRAQWPIFNHPWGEKWWRREGAGGRSLTLTFTSIQPFFFFFLQQHWTCSEWEREERREERDRVGGRETERQTGQCCAEGARCSYAEGCHSCCFSLKCASNVGCFQIHRGVVLLLLLLLLERSGRARRALCASRSTSPWTQRNHRERERGRGREGETTKCVLSWANAGDGWRLIVAQLSGEDCGQGRSLHCARTETPILPAPRILFFSFFFFLHNALCSRKCHLRGKSRRTKRLLPNMRPKWKVGTAQAPARIVILSLCVCVCVCVKALLRNLTTLLYMALSVQGWGVGQCFFFFL